MDMMSTAYFLLLMLLDMRKSLLDFPQEVKDDFSNDFLFTSSLEERNTVEYVGPSNASCYASFLPVKYAFVVGG